MEPTNNSGAIQALVVAIYEVGCLVSRSFYASPRSFTDFEKMGALGMIGYGDKLGRRRSILVGALIMCVGAVIQTTSFGLAQMIVGRIVTGFGNGMNTSAIRTLCQLSYGLVRSLTFLQLSGNLRWHRQRYVDFLSSLKGKILPNLRSQAFN